MYILCSQTFKCASFANCGGGKRGRRKCLSMLNWYTAIAEENIFLQFTFDNCISRQFHLCKKTHAAKSLNSFQNFNQLIVVKVITNCVNWMIISIIYALGDANKMYWLRIIKVTGIKLQELHFCVVLGKVKIA